MIFDDLGVGWPTSLWVKLNVKRSRRPTLSRKNNEIAHRGAAGPPDPAREFDRHDHRILRFLHLRDGRGVGVSEAVLSRPGTRSGAMNTQTNAIPKSSFGSQVATAAPISATRRMYWSLRREL